MAAEEPRVRTFVRVKPTADFAQDIINFGPDNKTIRILIKKDARAGAVNNHRTGWSFRLDGVLHNTSQELAYQALAEKLVSQALTGYNGTIMCYGQTGAGKTYTTMGPTTEHKQRGIIPRALEQVFKATAQSVEPVITVQISYLEIYNETMFDLLSSVASPGAGGIQLTVADCPGGVYVKGLSVHPVSHEEDALSLLFKGETNRVVAEHSLNRNSSRSHCIFTIYLESHFTGFSDGKCISSKINLIDLAGSERLSKTGSEGQLLKEATYINKSLSFLEQIIIALGDPKREHIPYRQSKLTHVLKDALGGTCNTVLVANICGEAEHVEETLSSLRFATRMKGINSEPLIRESYSQEGTVKAMEKEILLLKQELAVHDSLANRSWVTHTPLPAPQVAEIRSQVQKYLDGDIDEIDILNVRQVQEVFKQFKLIASQQEDDVETRFRSQYILIDRNDFVAVSALQQAGVVDMEGHVLEEEDEEDLESPPSDFSSRQSERRRSRRPSELSRRTGPRNSVFGREMAGLLPLRSLLEPSTKDVDEEEEEETWNEDTADPEAEVSTPAPVELPQRPRSPPPEPVAFELFKEECGREMNQIFKENKSILLARKKTSSEVVQKISFIKREMESTKEALEAHKQERLQNGEHVDEKGQIISDEEGFVLTTKLKDLKEEYRSGCAELQKLKAEIQNLQEVVDQCRKRLISEFEIWYRESFLIPKDVQEALKPGGNIRPGMIPINRVMCLEEDDQERYEKLQETTLPDGPASVSFYRAKMKTDQKRTFTRATSSLKQMHKKPGLLTPAGKKNKSALSAGHVSGVSSV
ncbi:PREDICTED: kinesin-like protein KIF9 [Chaetura pelagica]|uniref:kinesin-like protein KIF9 n=1 Tax=Chaetura pelagica TaxID=8897 RepID=UPI0005233B93|nr:PREDICTED: kinesin-like protein KIF9 [Chaetura pelagica]